MEQQLNRAMDNVMQRSMRRRLVCGRPFGLRSLEALVLEILLHNEQEGGTTTSPSQICAELGTQGPVLSPVLASLELRGYTTKKCDEADRRCRLVSLTDQGREIATAFVQDKERKSREMVDVLGEADAREFIRLLNRLSEYVDRLDAEKEELTFAENTKTP